VKKYIRIELDTLEAAARAGYEQDIREKFRCEPGHSWIAGSSQRTYSWEQLPDFCKEQWRAIAREMNNAFFGGGDSCCFMSQEMVT
jgi:hypothetical protein